MIQISEGEYESIITENDRLRSENVNLRVQVQIAEQARVTELARMRTELESLRMQVKTEPTVTTAAAPFDADNRRA